MLQSIEKYKITSVMAVPPQVLMLCKVLTADCDYGCDSKTNSLGPQSKDV